ncbi:MAG: hypothetical protein E6I76_14550 [Chloroflexi bacterium]|nr:MAG: hypothetical protein E6I76_14550 [Chloroflexota bacterium]
MAGEGGKKSDPTVPIILGIGVLLLIVLFGGCNGVNLPTYNGGGNTYNGSHGSHYSGGCDHYHRSDCGGGGDGRENDDRGSGHERRHHPGATETPDPDNR